MDKEQQIEKMAGTICNTCKEMIAVSENVKTELMLALRRMLTPRDFMPQAIAKSMRIAL